MSELQFPFAVHLALPTYLDHPYGKRVSGEEVDLPAANKEDNCLISFGLDRSLPPTILRAFVYCTSALTTTTTLREFATCVSNSLVRAGGGYYVEEDDDDEGTSSLYTLDGASDFTSKSQDSVSGSPMPAATVINRGDVGAREAEALRLVAAYTPGWESTARETAVNGTIRTRPSAEAAVVVTGTSGSLGPHIVQTLAEIRRCNYRLHQSRHQ
ncbi:hypothetical protein PISL3812_08997 [Talaromyces islandicus]|uniref:Uncharacterized protein n=1 Tax=Talaromyces islandicus TaxID=28573 RepID=A0A0U1M8J1_TALIS|nr:hypothetical protein PISL3812_08997 [Talaromyces islandicus]